MVSTIAGGDKQGYADGIGDKALFYNPRGIAIHPTDGDIYVADYYNFRIRKITPGMLELCFVV